MERLTARPHTTATCQSPCCAPVSTADATLEVPMKVIKHVPISSATHCVALHEASQERWGGGRVEHERRDGRNPTPDQIPCGPEAVLEELGLRDTGDGRGAGGHSSKKRLDLTVTELVFRNILRMDFFGYGFEGTSRTLRWNGNSSAELLRQHAGTLQQLHVEFVPCVILRFGSLDFFFFADTCAGKTKRP